MEIRKEPSLSKPSATERLDSWKEIAAYLKRDESTVRRWEKEGLPVHRHVHRTKAAVYAYKGEIDFWWSDGRAKLEVAEATAKLARQRFVAVALIAALLLVAGASFIYFRPTPALTESDYILVTDFENATGDAVFDGTLKQALAIKLAESPFLSIVPDQRVRETLQQMQRSPDEPVRGAIAREVCQRRRVKALVEGAIAALGSTYVITLNVINCPTGEVLAREQLDASRKERVLGALGEATSRLRRKLGESLASVRQYDTPLEEATTPSLEALKAYSLGMRQNSNDSIPFFERAIELDPDFAMAYAGLGDAYFVIGEAFKAYDYRRKAYKLRGRATERERLFLTWLGESAEGNMYKNWRNAEIWKQHYPRDSGPWVLSAERYSNTGEYEKALEAAQQATRLQPDAYAFELLAIAYRGLSRFGEAKAALERQLEVFPHALEAYNGLYEIAFAMDDTAALQQASARVRGTPVEAASLALQSSAAGFAGELRKARELSFRAVRLAQTQGRQQWAARVLTEQALMEAEFGHSTEARKQARAALALFPSLSLAGLPLARAGDLKHAQSLVEDIVRRLPPTDTWHHEFVLPTLTAAIELHRQNGAKAIESLERFRQYEMSKRVVRFYVPYLRGQAYLQTGAGREAAAEFEKILRNRGVAPLSPFYPLAYLGLGRASALVGDREATRQAYEAFFAAWKDADPDIPVLHEARAEYDRLN